MMLLLAGWVIAPTGILYLLYLVITDPGFTVTAFCWKVIACVAGAYLYFKFLEAFEGFARPQ
jgi:hypothetical protein